MFGAATFSRAICLALVLVFGGVCSIKGDAARTETAAPATRLLSDRLGNYVARTAATEITQKPAAEVSPAAFEITARASREYFSTSGKRFVVYLTATRSESAAYSLFTYLARKAESTNEAKPVAAGTAGVVAGDTIYFFRGPAFVSISITDASAFNEGLELSQTLASSLDQGDGDVPVLIQHLPSGATRRPTYAVSFETLQTLVPSQPILKEIDFEGGTEAVIANYGQSQVVIVEFTTPQFSIDNDQRIWSKISELKSQSQSTPIAYRRVGNYSVFVFNAPDEKTANALVDQVKYEQVVQWLGDDPYLADRLQRYFSRTTAGVLVAVIESSGLSLLICVGLGGLFGALLFRHRRARQVAFYSDAGGATRLNLDELTNAANSQRLLETRKQPKADS